MWQPGRQCAPNSGRSRFFRAPLSFCSGVSLPGLQRNGNNPKGRSPFPPLHNCNRAQRPLCFASVGCSYPAPTDRGKVPPTQRQGWVEDLCRAGRPRHGRRTIVGAVMPCSTPLRQVHPNTRAGRGSCHRLAPASLPWALTAPGMSSGDISLALRVRDRARQWHTILDQQGNPYPGAKGRADHAAGCGRSPPPFMAASRFPAVCPGLPPGAS